MADKKKLEGFQVAPLQVFDCESLPIPPGTKSTYKGPHWPYDLEQPTTLRSWLIGSGAVVAALVVGILIGRFLIP